ncbi:MAG: hypothetical protein JWN86_1564 [Planctomycetota bacterium]|nr:hypothetical protein [Planctomycetota bacterium]
MNVRTMIVAGLAVIFGLGAAIGIRAMKQPAAVAAVATRAVVFVSADIQRGVTIKEASLEIRQVPRDQAADNAIDKTSDVVDRIARIPMLKGDVVSDAKLEPKGAKSRTVPSGKLAFTISKADMPTLEVDDHVDVYFTNSGSGGPPVASSSLQNIPVWEVTPPNATTPNTSAGPVTLLVDPDQAEALNRGMNAGTLRFARRNAADPVRPATLAPQPIPVPIAEDTDLAIPEGKRAFTIHAPSPSPFLEAHSLKGRSVDILMTTKSDGGTAALPSEAVVYVLVQNVEVHDAKALVAGSDPSSRNGSAERAILAVTLLVDPGEVTRLVMGQSAGTFHISLRHPRDHQVDAEPPVLMKTTRITAVTLKGTRLGQDTRTSLEPVDRRARPLFPRDSLAKTARAGF